MCRFMLVKVVIAVGLFFQSCGGDLRFQIETRSPRGTYHVTLEGVKSPATALPGEFYVQNVKLVADKENRPIVVEQNFFKADHYDPSFFDVYPLNEWTNDFTLRLGDRNPQHFLDTVVIRNMTDVELNLVIVDYGRFERFLIFDINPGKSVTLQTSPQFDRGQPASGVAYTAYSQDRFFSGAEQRSGERKVEDGPIKTSVEITNKAITRK